MLDELNPLLQKSTCSILQDIIRFWGKILKIRLVSFLSQRERSFHHPKTSRQTSLAVSSNTAREYSQLYAVRVVLVSLNRPRPARGRPGLRWPLRPLWTKIRNLQDTRKLRKLGINLLERLAAVFRTIHRTVRWPSKLIEGVTGDLTVRQYAPPIHRCRIC